MLAAKSPTIYYYQFALPVKLTPQLAWYIGLMALSLRQGNNRAATRTSTGASCQAPVPATRNEYVGFGVSTDVDSTGGEAMVYVRLFLAMTFKFCEFGEFWP